MIRVLVVAALLALLGGCGGASEKTDETASASKPPAASQTPAASKGIGPVREVALGPVDPAVAAHGQKIFDSKCATCHKFEERYVGPALAGVTERREPEWIMNMILNPAQMIQEDPTAKELFVQYLTPMTFQNVTEEDAKAIFTYFRSKDEGTAASGGSN